jgi:hypothetical protein
VEPPAKAIGFFFWFFLFGMNMGGSYGYRRINIDNNAYQIVAY